MYWFRAGLPTLQGGRLDILWCVPRPALKHHSQSIHFLCFSEKKIKKIKSREQLCTGQKPQSWANNCKKGPQR